MIADKLTAVLREAAGATLAKTALDEHTRAELTTTIASEAALTLASRLPEMLHELVAKAALEVLGQHRADGVTVQDLLDIRVERQIAWQVSSAIGAAL